MENKKEHLQGDTTSKACLNDDDLIRLELFTLMIQEDYAQHLHQQRKFLQQFMADGEKTHQQSLKQMEQLNKLLQKEDQSITCQPLEKFQTLRETMRKNSKILQQLMGEQEKIQSELAKIKIQYEEQHAKLATIQSNITTMKGQILNHHESEKNYDSENQKLEHFVVKLDSQCQQLFQMKKILNNELQEVKGNIRVYCRIRPPNVQNETPAINVTTENNLKLLLKKDTLTSQKEQYDQSFCFDLIFNSTDSQQHVFNEMSQLIQNAIDGKNVCIFAYGQTGSGKTYTLHGPQEAIGKCETVKQIHRGLTSRSIQLIFKAIQQNKVFNWTYRVILSVQEIYMETIIDLISNEKIEMNNQIQMEVFSVSDVQAVIAKAIFHRKTSETNCNERSSRSHLIVTILLKARYDNSPEEREGSLVLVDLAGSERLKQSKSQGEILKETQFINKSLSSLGSVINGLRHKSEHIPYRNSKLTHLLQKYLQGEGKTLMIVNVSPDRQDASQTKISLGFAQGVREFKSGNKK